MNEKQKLNNKNNNKKQTQLFSLSRIIHVRSTFLDQTCK
jgi:hypothetical protein